MAISAFIPEQNKTYVFKKHSLLLLEKGDGIFQVDFRNYSFSGGKAIFLSPGQYFQLLAGSYTISLIEIQGDNISREMNSRFLFKHLVSLGHIDLTRPSQFHLKQLRYLDVSGSTPEILHQAIDEWLSQNPFQATQTEINLLFDIKDIVDARFREPLSLSAVSSLLHQKPYTINTLAKQKLDTTIKRLAGSKLLLEAQRQVTFTDLPTKEIAYELGFSDPKYFNRFFKQHTQRTPWEFREEFEVADRDTFMAGLSALINDYHTAHHSAAFYAGKLNITTKTLTRKVQQKLGLSFTQLLQQKLLTTAKERLANGESVTEIAFGLGFSEPNHFSSFFKSKTGLTPSQSRSNC